MGLGEGMESLNREREEGPRLKKKIKNKNTRTASPIYRGHGNSHRLAQDGCRLRRRGPVHSEGEQPQRAKQQEGRRISGCYIPGRSPPPCTRQVFSDRATYHRAPAARPQRPPQTHPPSRKEEPASELPTLTGRVRTPNISGS